MHTDSKNKIILKRATIRNFMSYGNNVNEFPFLEGMNWLSAPNGCGKSTIVEAITFAFFGKSYRGGTLAELRNTLNIFATTEVTLEFDREQGKTRDEYFIRRTIDPKGTSKFVLEKKDGDKWVQQNKRAGFTQKDFENDILHLDILLFKNMVAMNTQEFEPFISQEPVDRRKLTDSIIMCNTERLKKENNKELSLAKTNFELATNDKDRIEGEISNLHSIIARMEEEKKTNIAQMEATVDEKKAEAAQQGARAQSIREEMAGMEKSLGELKAVIDTEPDIDRRIAGISNARMQVGLLQQYRADLAVAQSEFDAANKKYAELPVDDVNRQINEIQSSILDVNNEIGTVESRIAATNSTITAHDAKINTLTRERGNAEVSIRNMEFQATQLSNQMNDITAQAKNLKPIEIGIPCPTCGKPTDENDVERSKQQIEAQKVELRQKYVALKGQVSGLNEQVASLNEKISRIDSDIEAEQGAKETLRLEIQDLNANAQTLRTQIQAHNAEIQNLNYRLSEFGRIYNETVIPAKASIDQLNAKIASAESVIAQTGINVDAFVSEEARLRAEKERIATARNNWQTLYNAYSAKNGEYSAITGSVNQLNQEIARISAEIQRVKDATNEDALAMTQKRLVDAQAELDATIGKWHEASKTIAACEYISGMLSENGMKKMIYQLYIDHFNESVRKNLLKANLPFVITFDETMKDTFISAPGYAPTFDMLSQGQQRKVGFAIAMAFRDFVSMVGNFDLNFMSLDEVLDISTDNTAMREMLGMVRSMVDEIGCVVVITHRGEVVADMFDHKITLAFDGTYSHMGEITDT